MGDPVAPGAGSPELANDPVSMSGSKTPCVEMRLRDGTRSSELKSSQSTTALGKHPNASHTQPDLTSGHGSRIEMKGPTAWMNG